MKQMIGLSRFRKSQVNLVHMSWRSVCLTTKLQGHVFLEVPWVYALHFSTTNCARKDPNPIDLDSQPIRVRQNWPQSPCSMMFLQIASISSIGNPSFSLYQCRHRTLRELHEPENLGVFGRQQSFGQTQARLAPATMKVIITVASNDMILLDESPIESVPALKAIDEWIDIDHHMSNYMVDVLLAFLLASMLALPVFAIYYKLLRYHGELVEIDLCI